MAAGVAFLSADAIARAPSATTRPSVRVAWVQDYPSLPANPMTTSYWPGAAPRGRAPIEWGIECQAGPGGGERGPARLAMQGNRI